MGRRVCGEERGSAGTRRGVSHGKEGPAGTGAKEEEGCDRGKEKMPVGVGDQGMGVEEWARGYRRRIGVRKGDRRKETVSGKTAGEVAVNRWESERGHRRKMRR